MTTLALISASCAVGSATTTMQDLADETNQIYQLLLPSGADIVPGTNRVIFAIFDNEGEFVRDLDLSLYYGPDTGSEPTGPAEVIFESEGLADNAFYRAELELDSPGEWPVLIVENGTEEKQGAGSELTVKESSAVPQVGDKAPEVATPTTHDHLGVPDICTSEPEDPLHYISLDAALRNDKPSVVVLGTPAFCSSRLCGPVVDQVVKVWDDVGAEAANFIHIEVYIDVNENTFLKSFEAWTLNSEPWVFAIDGDGIIRSRFEGPVTPGEISEALGVVLEA